MVAEATSTVTPVKQGGDDGDDSGFWGDFADKTVAAARFFVSEIVRIVRGSP